jgi:hypothetical protein
MYEIAYDIGGTIPTPLRGLYTSKSFADEAIERFLVGANRKQSNGQ